MSSGPGIDPYDLAGRIALVTGGTSGIGKAIALGFCRAGVRVYISGRDEAKAAHVASQIALQTGGTCIGLGGDLRSMAGARAVVADISRSEKELHILVNNAGCEAVAPIDDFSEADWDLVLEVNLKAPFFLVRDMLDLLRRAGTADRPATVINVGSVGGLRIGPKENYSYAASKAALHHITGSLAKRLGPENIVVNAIAPGFFRTELTRSIAESAVAALVDTLPARRIGRDEDIQALTGFLASAGASYVTGAVIPLAGGLTL